MISKYFYIVLIFLTLLFVRYFSEVIDQKIAAHYQESLSSTLIRNGSAVLGDVFPFDWDEAYVIKETYIGGDTLDESIGLDLNLPAEDVDFLHRIAFLKDKKLSISIHIMIRTFLSTMEA